MSVITRLTRLPDPIHLGLLFALTVTATPALADDWRYTQHDIGGTAHSDGEGTLAADLDGFPGQLFDVSLDELGLGLTLLEDVNGDGVSDLLTVLGGRVTAFDGDGSGQLWETTLRVSPDMRGVFDIDGDGVATDLVVVDDGLPGGVFVMDVTTGGLLWEYGPLTERSGVDQQEITVGDIDGDGIAELFFTEDIYGNENAYAVSFALGFNGAEVIELPLPAELVHLTPSVGGDLLGTGLGAVLVQQGADLSLLETCEPADADAVCTASETLCLCDRGYFEDVHPSESRGVIHAVDVDGDPAEEVLEIQKSSQYGVQISLFDTADGMATGAPVTDDLYLWAYDYGWPEPATGLVLPDGEPEDLDGDGDLDIYLTFYDNTLDEVDAWGTPADDGIDHADGFAVGVYDLLTGELVASIVDAIAWGTADLDADGINEIITSPTSGWAYLNGISGVALDCDPDCEVVEMWSDLSHTLWPDIQELDGASFPSPILGLMDLGADGAPELLAWDGYHLDLLEVVHGGTSIVATVLPTEEEYVAALAEDGSHLLLVGDTTTRLLGADLMDAATDLVPRGQVTADVLAVQLDHAQARAALVAQGAVFWSDPSPGSMADADIRTEPRVLFAEDLTGDIYPEIVAFAKPEESPDGAIRLEAISFDPLDPDGDGTPFGVLWTFLGADHEELSGYTSYSHQLGRPADLDGDGWLEVVLGCHKPSTYEQAILVLDGQTGALEEFWVETFFASNKSFNLNMPIYVADLVDETGAGVPDGKDDLLLSDTRNIYLLPGGTTEPTSTWATTRTQWEGAFADLDGNGGIELVMMKGSTAGSMTMAIEIQPTLEDFWGDMTDLLGQKNNSTTENIALVRMDGEHGFDVAYLSGSGSVELFDGDTGLLAPGYPMYLAGGVQLPASDDLVASLTAAAAYDADGDGFDELLVGGDDGWLYALTVDPAEGQVPEVGWSFYTGTPVKQVRVADLDGDGFDEIAVSGPDSRVRVIDGFGAQLDIEQPGSGECLAESTFVVSGNASEVATVDIEIGGVLATTGIPVSGGVWESPDIGTPGVGTWEIQAAGLNADGQELLYDTVSVVFDGDQDGDGFTLCGNDCDDSNPALTPEDADGDGLSSCDGDCDDTDATLNLDDLDGDGHTTCDGDCDDTDPALNLDDADGDGFSTCDGDCEDTDGEIYPGADETCEDGIDQDCDGFDGDCYPEGDDDDGEVTGGCNCTAAGSVEPAAGLGALLLGITGFGLVVRRRSAVDRRSH